VAIAVFAGALGLGVFFWRRKVQKRRNWARRNCDNSKYVTIPLLATETGVRGAMSVSTITFFKGDSKAAEDWIKRRTVEVVKVNPWLAGRLVSSNEDSRYHLCHPKSVSEDEVQDHIKVMNSSSLHPSMSYKDMVENHSHLLIKRGVDCIDMDESLFRVMLFHISADSFALTISISHMLGDGNTYYKIYSMFSCKQSVTPLTIARRHDFADCSNGIIRLRELLTCKLFLIRALLFSLLPKPKAIRVFITELDPEWVAAEKKRHCPNPSKKMFVSTNDLLVSWWMNTSKLDFCIMAFNARGRIPGLKVTSILCCNGMPFSH